MTHTIVADLIICNSIAHRPVTKLQHPNRPNTANPDSSPAPNPGEWVRRHTLHWAHTCGTVAHRMGLHPDVITVVGTLFVVAGGVAAGWGQFGWAAWLILIGSLLDALDGAVARVRGLTHSFGAVLDSFLDRYADGFIFIGLSYHFARQNQLHFMLLAMAAMVGSYAVSYVRARAAAPDVGISVRIGYFTRFERMAVLLIALWFSRWLLLPGLWVLAIGTHLTALQRLWFVRQHTTGTQE